MPAPPRGELTGPAIRAVVTRDPLNAETPLAALGDDLTPVPSHFIRCHFPVPEVGSGDAWALSVGGSVEAPAALALADLKRLPERTVTLTMECAGNGRRRMRPTPGGTPWGLGAVATGVWSGASLRSVLESARPRPGAVEVVFRGADAGVVENGREAAFERSLPLDVAMDPDTLLAWELDGEPLPPEQGFPLRLIVPRWYGVASVKWLEAVEVVDRPFEGWFQRERYVYEDPGSDLPPEPVRLGRPRALVAAPQDGARVPAGRRLVVRGHAWSGMGAVEKVEWRVEGITPWRDAELGLDAGPYAWRAFTFAWTPPSKGAFTLLARAVDESGETQPLEAPWNRLGYGNNAVAPVRVHAT